MSGAWPRSSSSLRQKSRRRSASPPSIASAASRRRARFSRSSSESSASSPPTRRAPPPAGRTTARPSARGADARPAAAPSSHSASGDAPQAGDASAPKQRLVVERVGDDAEQGAHVFDLLLRPVAASADHKAAAARRAPAPPRTRSTWVNARSRSYHLPALEPAAALGHGGRQRGEPARQVPGLGVPLGRRVELAPVGDPDAFLVPALLLDDEHLDRRTGRRGLAGLPSGDQRPVAGQERVAHGVRDGQHAGVGSEVAAQGQGRGPDRARLGRPRRRRGGSRRSTGTRRRQ